MLPIFGWQAMANHDQPWQAIQKSPKVTKKYIEAKWKKEVKLLHMIAPEKHEPAVGCV